MKNPFTIIGVTLLLILLFSRGMVFAGMAEDSSLSYDVGTSPAHFKFGDDAVVKINLEGGGTCKIKVTRQAKADTYFDNLCSENWYQKSKPVKEPTPQLTGGQYSVYKIELDGPCTAENFPIHVEIVNYGTAELEKGQYGSAYKLRLVHKASDGRCTDITTNIDANIDPSKDAKGGGGEDSKSDFFLVNLADKIVADTVRMDVRFGELLQQTDSIIMGERDRIVDARIAFNSGVAAGRDQAKAIPFYRITCRTLKEYLVVIKNAKASPRIPDPTKANLLLVRPGRILFDIRQLMQFNGLSVPAECGN